MMKYETGSSFARSADRADPLKDFRKQFYYPSEGQIYFTGNSLGLQPKTTGKLITEELHDWSQLAVEGHLHSRRPWLYYHKFTKKYLANLLGARQSEVVAMNSLTVNLHLLMASFYRPSGVRRKILMEAGAFSSDQYAVESQVRHHGLSPEEVIIEVAPRAGEFLIDETDLLHSIANAGEELALVLLPGVQYYSGQVFSINKIVQATHAVGAIAGFDLAHAAGNIPLKLHRDKVDFAVWCSYKYLNSGPGGIAGAFVHERHHQENLPRFAGWWGHREEVRFRMEKGFIPMPGVDGWQLSNVPILQGAAHLAALEIFHKAGMSRIRKKSLDLTGYLLFLLKSLPATDKFRIITPAQAKQRGAQLSFYFPANGRNFFSELTAQGVVADWREPGVIRIAPAPLYNTFSEVYRFVNILKNIIY